MKLNGKRVDTAPPDDCPPYVPVERPVVTDAQCSNCIFFKGVVGAPEGYCTVKRSPVRERADNWCELYVAFHK